MDVPAQSVLLGHPISRLHPDVQVHQPADRSQPRSGAFYDDHLGIWTNDQTTVATVCQPGGGVTMPAARRGGYSRADIGKGAERS